MRKTSKSKRKNIVTIGGGTGTYTVLTGLKAYPFNLSAIVTMADDGGSTGILRDELGVLPPGDVRQCLVALSRSDRLMRELMNYRFSRGSLKGHNFGNILLSALEKVTGSFDSAVEKASDILRLAGKVIPATLNKVHLRTTLKDGTVLERENDLHTANLETLQRIALFPRAKANLKALLAIAQADAIIIGPGDFYSSLVPNFLIAGMPEAICKSKAKKIFICNLMTKQGHTRGWTVRDFAEHMEQYMRCVFDFVIYNNKRPQPSLLKKYARGGELLTEWGKKLPSRFIGDDLISKKFPTVKKGDAIKRTLIRHDSNKLARIIIDFLRKTR